MSIRKHVLLAVALLLCSSALTHAQGLISGGPAAALGETRLLPAAPFQSAMVGLAPRPYGAIRAAPVARHYAARTHRRIYRGFQSAPVALNVAPIATVQPDNYRNWRQACCF